MTEKQRLFAEEYVRDRNPIRAYRAAYPRIRTDDAAHACASRMLRNAKFSAVQAYIAELLDKAADEAVADSHEVLSSLTAILRGQTEEEVVVTESLGGGVSQTRIITKRPSERDRLRAAELLAKYHQLLVPRVQVETEHSGGVIVLAEATEGEP